MRRRSKAEIPGLDELADDALLRLAGREPEAFAVFYRRHARAVLGFFTHRTTCREDAADLTAETFAQAFLARRRYRPTGAPARAWLLAIARHQLAHHQRAARTAYRARSRLGMRPVPAGDEAFDQLEASLDAQTYGPPLQHALDDLTDGVADAVRFRVVDGLPYDAIADRLGCTEAAARQRVSRGLAQLADHLEVDR